MQIDWIGLAETHIDSTKCQVQEKVKTAIDSLQESSHSNSCFSESDLDYGTDYKRGGTLQIAVNNLATRTNTSYSDLMGRFTSQTFARHSSKKLTILTVYRMVDGSSGPSSAHAQQRAMLVALGSSADPRTELVKDLIEFVKNVQLQESSRIVCIDANESLKKRTLGTIQRLLDACALVDLHSQRNQGIEQASHRRGAYRKTRFHSSVVPRCHSKRNTSFNTLL